MDIGPEWIPGVIGIIVAAVWCGRLEQSDKNADKELGEIVKRLNRLDEFGTRGMGPVRERLSQVDTNLDALLDERQRTLLEINALATKVAVLSERQEANIRRIDRIADILGINGNPPEREPPPDRRR